jgi:hypothetical protein
MTIISHDVDGRAENKNGNLYVEERAYRLPNANNYGDHLEHGATTRSRALKRAREAFGPDAVILENLGVVHIGTDTRRRYSIAIVPGTGRARAVTGFVTYIDRHGHTVNGNPMMSVTLQIGGAVTGAGNTEGWTLGVRVSYRLSNDASLAYAIDNAEYRNQPHTFALTAAGRISHVVR